MSETINSETEVVTAFDQIPYALLNQELDKASTDLLAELTQIQRYYNIYEKGAKFIPEGSQGDYIPAMLKFMLAATLINKEARFLFAEAPDIIVEPKGDVGKITTSTKDAITIFNDLLKTVFTENKFEGQLVKAAKDCFIGKRVAGLINFNEDDGIIVSFLPSTQFIYETQVGNHNELVKFVAFMVVKPDTQLSNKQILRKRLTLENGKVFVEETIFDGTGASLVELTPKRETLLTSIPAVVFLNDGLSGDTKGESEIDKLDGFESWYSKLANADTDAERKAMNEVKFTVDMSQDSTKNLKVSPGAYWDLQSDQNLSTAKPEVGTLSSNMAYSEALETTLERIKSSAYDMLDIPMLSLDSLKGQVTTGKALKAIYWPLVVRCKEKMKTWGPGLRAMAQIIIDGSLEYPNVAKKYISDTLMPVEYEIKIDQNQPLPEDEAEEKTIDLAEVAGQTMSRKAYMVKWRGLTDEEADAELKQIALENIIISDHTGINVSATDVPNAFPQSEEWIQAIEQSEGNVANAGTE